ncbi:hypothetical protein CCM_00571 [Cordyceps militaris CM01]|uniref:Uncharacterized protein n=1 Tax=Cordyceps militaris (strain CM01) TaxID=983644 RepID=G3J4V0_CORMM|nr:uncharacterized protein CCM_00571 [Cordyceps militaris CM01]EGX95917.1 hypothetical protein CCM_00571 [Cordyceps militaris CM01]
MAGTGSWRMHKLPSFVVPLFREGPDRIWLLTRRNYRKPREAIKVVEVETTSMHTPAFPPSPLLPASFCCRGALSLIFSRRNFSCFVRELRQKEWYQIRHLKKVVSVPSARSGLFEMSSLAGVSQVLGDGRPRLPLLHVLCFASRRAKAIHRPARQASLLRTVADLGRTPSPWRRERQRRLAYSCLNVRLIPLGSGRRNPPWTACRAKAVARRSLASPVTTPVRFSQIIQLVQVHIPTMCRLSNTGCRVEELYASDTDCSYHAASAPGQFSGDI